MGLNPGVPSIKHQASNIKYQASSIKHQTSSIKHQASNIKHQTASTKHQVPSTKHRASNIPGDACKKGHCLSNGTFTTTTVSSASGGHQLYYSCRFRQQLGPILTVWTGYLDTHFESRRKPYFVT